MRCRRRTRVGRAECKARRRQFHQRHRGHRQRAVHKGKRIVGSRERTGRRSNRIGAGCRSRCGSGAQGWSRGQAGCIVTVDKTTVAGRQGWYSAAIGAALIVSRDRQRRLADGQSAIDISNDIIVIHGAAGCNRIDTDRGSGSSGSGQRGKCSQASLRVAVDKTCIAGRQRR